MTPKQYFEDHPNCELCGEPATEVHHIFHKRKGNKELETEMNYISLCHECHVSAHNQVQYTADKIFETRQSQEFVDYANKIGHKTWVNRS